MISHKLKFIFLHIPKTSGTSLSIFLKDLVEDKVEYYKECDYLWGEKQNVKIICSKTGTDIKHHNITYYERIYGKKIKDYFQFMIVRNPYDRVLSLYLWYKGKDNQTFVRSEFINFVKKQTNFQYLYFNKNIHVVYFENLIDDLKKIDCFKGHVDFDNYPVINSSSNSKKKYSEIYDEKLKILVFGKYKKDFETFKYKF